MYGQESKNQDDKINNEKRKGLFKMTENKKKELQNEAMDKVAGGGWEKYIAPVVDVANQLLNGGGSSGGSDSGSGGGASEGQNNSNNNGAQQNNISGPNTVNDMNISK